MKLGKNFGFWIRIIMAILDTALKFAGGSTESVKEPGERIAVAVLDVVIKNNEDDDLKSVHDAESLA